MISLRQRSVRVLASAAILTSGLGSLALLNASATAHADPQYELPGQPLVGVGSDTIQDLFNAYSGAEPSQGAQPSAAPHLNTVFYTPSTGQLVSSGANGSLGIASFDATNPHQNYTNPDTGDFITTKLNGATFDRPNGSGDGRKALDAAINSGTFSNLSQPAESVAGQIDFARSSSLGSSAVASTNPLGSDMQYIPFAADGVAYAFICTVPGSANCTGALKSLSATDLAALYSGNGKLAAGSWGGGGTTENLAACAIQVGSGTFQFFLAKLGLGSDDRQTAQNNLSAAGASGCFGLEENNLDTFLTTTGGLAAANTDWIIPMSMANVIAQHNNVSLDRSNNFFNANGTDISGLGIAAVGGGALPYGGDGTATWTPSDTYDAGLFGRWVFVVVPTKSLTGGTRVKAIDDIFYNATATGGLAQLCTTASKALMAQFGFDPALPNDSTFTGGTCGVPAFQGTN